MEFTRSPLTISFLYQQLLQMSVDVLPKWQVHGHQKQVIRQDLQTRTKEWNKKFSKERPILAFSWKYTRFMIGVCFAIIITTGLISPFTVVHYGKGLLLLWSFSAVGLGVVVITLIVCSGLYQDKHSPKKIFWSQSPFNKFKEEYEKSGGKIVSNLSICTDADLPPHRCSAPLCLLKAEHHPASPIRFLKIVDTEDSSCWEYLDYWEKPQETTEKTG